MVNVPTDLPELRHLPGCNLIEAYAEDSEPQSGLYQEDSNMKTEREM